MSSDVDKLIVTAITVLIFVAMALFWQMVENRRGDRLGLGFLLLAVVSALGLGVFLWAGAARASDCACLENGDGACMTLAKGMYPYRQADDWLQGPHCVTGCYPGFNDVYGYSAQTRKELAACRIDWRRLGREMGRKW